MRGSYEVIQHLLVRSQLGEITLEEQRVIDRWRQEKKSHEALYQRIIDRGRIRDRLEELQNMDVDGAFVRNQKILKHRAYRRILLRSLPYAALLALMLGVMLLWPEAPEKKCQTVTTQSIGPGTRQAELILADGSAVHLLPGMQETLHDGISEVVVTGNALNYAEMKTAAKISYHSIRTPLGGEYAIVLADGTKVWLNAMSELKYPVVFDGKERRVELKGEAFFKVKQDTARPFYVEVADYRIRVLGTSFNVKAYEDEECWQTTLCSGKVKVSSLTNKQDVVLEPGKQAVCNRKNGRLEVKEVDTGLFTAWTKGEFQFDNTSIEEIFIVLQRWYKIEVFYTNSQVRKEVFTGKLPRFDDLQVILDIMGKVSDLQFERKGNTILIK